MELKNQLYSLWTSGFFCVYLCLSLVDHELPANCCTTTLPLERVPKPVGGTKDEAAKPFGVYKGGNKKRWCFPILIPDFHGLGIQFIYLNPICFLTFFMFGGCHQYRAVSKSFDQVHPGRLTWNLRITHFERKMIFQTSMIMFQPLIFRGVSERKAPMDPAMFHALQVLVLKHCRIPMAWKLRFS